MGKVVNKMVIGPRDKVPSAPDPPAAHD
jgi:hypothetical protein